MLSFQVAAQISQLIKNGSIMADRIFTLGYEALSLNTFIARLKEAGVYSRLSRVP